MKSISDKDFDDNEINFTKRSLDDKANGLFNLALTQRPKSTSPSLADKKLCDITYKEWLAGIIATEQSKLQTRMDDIAAYSLRIAKAVIRSLEKDEV